MQLTAYMCSANARCNHRASRDNVWTNSTVTVPGLNPETDPEGQTAMAVLAGGPYGPADIAGSMNRSLIMRSCREDGVLLRADKPATAIDASWTSSFADLKPRHVWGTYSQIGSARWSYILALNLDEPLNSVPMVTLDDTPAGSANGWVAYEGWHGIVHGAFTNVDSRAGYLNIPRCPQKDTMTLGHSLWVVAPVLPFGWVYLGEDNKLVVASRRRLKAWNATSATQLSLSLLAAPNEHLQLAVLGPQQRRLATRFSCVASGASTGRAVAFGDVDVDLQVECTISGAAVTCTCA